VSTERYSRFLTGDVATELEIFGGVASAYNQAAINTTQVPGITKKESVTLNRIGET
jgi:hypothetical protein